MEPPVSVPLTFLKAHWDPRVKGRGQDHISHIQHLGGGQAPCRCSQIYRMSKPRQTYFFLRGSALHYLDRFFLGGCTCVCARVCAHAVVMVGAGASSLFSNCVRKRGQRENRLKHEQGCRVWSCKLPAQVHWAGKAEGPMHCWPSQDMCSNESVATLAKMLYTLTCGWEVAPAP